MASLTGALVTDQGSVYFSPEDCLEKRLIQLIDEENKSIHLAIYCMTHREIGEALIRAKKRGVDVQVIVDKYSVKMRAPLAKMVDGGISICVWDSKNASGKKNERALMHNKFCVFGDESVWTGSFNFTYSASRLHQENAVVLRNREMASEFKKQFNNIKMRGCLPFSSYITYHAYKPSKKGLKK
jgi:phosphatidylserine/phosphatidylglycerophosphate/cardiolipin synthase-like enzyme